MWTYHRLDLQTRGSQPVMPTHCSSRQTFLAGQLNEEGITLIRFITMFYGTDTIPRSVPQIQTDCGKYFVEYCWSRMTLLLIWIMLCKKKRSLVCSPQHDVFIMVNYILHEDMQHIVSTSLQSQHLFVVINFFKLASNILVYIKERVCSRGHWKYNHWGKMWSTTPSPISHCCPPFLWISQQGGVRSDPKEHAKLYLYGRSDSLCSCWHQNRPKIRTVSPKTKVRWGGLKGGQTETIVHGGLILGPKPHP